MIKKDERKFTVYGCTNWVCHPRSADHSKVIFLTLRASHTSNFKGLGLGAFYSCGKFGLQ